MKRPSPASPTNAHRHSGFSLIEVTVALGLITFTLVTLVGMLGIGMTSMRTSMTQATVARISSQVASEVQSGTWRATPGSVTLYYAENGTEVENAINGGYRAVVTPLDNDASLTSYWKSWKFEIYPVPSGSESKALLVSRSTASL